MNDRTSVTGQEVRQDQRQDQAAPAAPTVAPPEVVPPGEVLRQIRRDSRQAPEQYLSETKVPFGGE